LNHPDAVKKLHYENKAKLAELNVEDQELFNTKDETV
jgi:hypothetical protein